MILGNKIKDGLAIKSSIKRIAYQIYENNIAEKSIVIVGIGNRGKIFRNLIGSSIKSICDLKIIFVSLSIKKKKLLNVAESDILLEEIKNKSIIIVDDVLNTGSTLIYAVSYFLKIPVKKIQTAVMVNRNHKKFPIKADFKGISLSTSVNEHISVILEGNEIGIYLS
tara:strand:+ start:522 stop:1022 length:501 start_codon:yes stop_codon:yes gene_type:complete